MQQLTAPSILALFETDRKQRLSFAEIIVNAVENGEINPLDAHLQIKGMADIVNTITDKSPKTNKNFELAEKYNRLLMDEAELNGKSFERHQAKFQITEVGVAYDFSSCEDPIIDELFVQEKQLKGKIDQRKAELKTVPDSGRSEINQETGEVFTVYPPKKTSTTSLKVTLK